MHPSMLVEIAADLRLRANQTEPAFSTRHIVEARFPGALVTGRVLPAGIDEAVSATRDGVVILYSRSLPTPSQRFVIAHALAHLLFDHRHGACRPGSVGDENREERADRFAAELLIPLDRLAEYVGRWPSANEVEQHKYLDQVDEIASHFQVPSGLVDRRIRELRTIGKHVALSS